MPATEYRIGEELWLVADAPGLCALFAIEPSALPAWHARMAEKEMFFFVCCRQFGVRPVTEMDPARMVCWDDRLTAENKGMAVEAVADLRERAVSWWKRFAAVERKKAKSRVALPKLEQGAQMGLGGMETGQGGETGRPGDDILTNHDTEVPPAMAAKAQTGLPPAPQGSPPAANAVAMPPERPAAPAAPAGNNSGIISPGKVTLSEAELAKLRRFGFGAEKDPDVCAYLLARFEDLGDLLESAADRPAVMQMLQDEVTLTFAVNTRIGRIRGDIKRAVDGGLNVPSLDAENLEKLLVSSAKLQKAIETAKESLGVGESESGGVALAKAIRKNASTLIEAHREFHADGDRERLDGVFSYAELVILTKPYGDRPAQWRPDLPIIAAQVAERLFDKKCDPAVPTRAQQRRLRKALRQVMEAMLEEDGTSMEDLSDETGDDDVAPVGVALPATPAPVPDGAVAPVYAATAAPVPGGQQVFD